MKPKMLKLIEENTAMHQTCTGGGFLDRMPLSQKNGPTIYKQFTSLIKLKPFRPTPTRKEFMPGTLNLDL